MTALKPQRERKEKLTQFTVKNINIKISKAPAINEGRHEEVLLSIC